MTLKELRKMRGLTLQQVADAAEVTYQAVQQWEEGQTVPGTRKLSALADIYGVEVGILLDALQSPSSEDKEAA